MQFNLNEKVYAYYNQNFPLIEGEIIKLTTEVKEIFYIGDAYIIKTSSGIFDVPERQVFKSYEEWQEYYNTIS